MPQGRRWAWLRCLFGKHEWVDYVSAVTNNDARYCPACGRVEQWVLVDGRRQWMRI